MFGRALDDPDIAKEVLQPKIDALDEKLKTETDSEIREKIIKERKVLLDLLK